MLLSFVAYIDPGSGSLLFQMLIAAALAVGVGLRQARQRAATLLRTIFGRKDASTSDASQNESRN